MRKQGIFFCLSLLPCMIAAAADFSLGIDSPEIVANSCRERQCLNGLWRFHPLAEQNKVTDTPPQKGTGWGYFKVPGIWPQGAGNNSFKPMLPDETLLKQAGKWHTAWYRREFAVPAKAEGKKLVAVGTTTVRTLESAYKMFGTIQACKGASELFIYPPYEFKVVDKLITNFHLPKSTLLMLVSALASKDFIFEAYSEAIKEKYRFYSYGDCMFIN